MTEDDGGGGEWSENPEFYMTSFVNASQVLKCVGGTGTGFDEYQIFLYQPEYNLIRKIFSSNIAKNECGCYPVAK